jgi:hypothetical protein
MIRTVVERLIWQRGFLWKLVRGAGLLAALSEGSGLARCVRPTTVAVQNQAVGAD